MRAIDDSLRAELESRLQFETLLADLSARFVHVPAEEVDREVNDALRLLCEHLGNDTAAFWQPLDEDPGNFLLTHHRRAPAGPPTPERMDAKTYFPWSLDRLLRGEVVMVSQLSDIPAEAVRELEVRRHFNLKSTLAFPLSTGGGPLFGILSFDSMTKEIAWPEPLVHRLQLIAQVFINALARKRSELALRESEARLALAADSAGTGLWSLDPATGRFWVSDRARKLFEFPADNAVTLAVVLQSIHPEDRERVEQAVERMLQSGETGIVEYRVPLRDGSVRWLSSRGQTQPGPAGKGERLMGSTLDITEWNRAQEAVRASERKFRMLHESMMDAFVSVDMQGNILEFNAVYQQLLGYSEKELRQRTFMELTPERWHACEDEILRAQVLRRGYSDIYEKEYRRKDGTVFPVELRTFLIRDEAGQAARMWAIVRDITSRKMDQDALLRSLAEIKELKDRLQAESDYLKAEIKVTQTHGEVIGNSQAIKRVLQQVEQVAHTDSSVLITGETGTGKELLARAIHRLSRRKDRVMVMVNCAALPGALVESELFGREKGAFTGALMRQAGRFELADGSTIFLDEVGELSPEVQAKLLRVLQSGEFERLGSSKTLQANVRLIAATNRDLAQDVRKGRFREDLFYRLNVFPIRVPPLRERREDIPELVWRFLEELCPHTGKKITKVSRKTMAALQAYSWPGNVRELRNVIEHGVIVTTGDTLRVAAPGDPSQTSAASRTLAELQREHILETLERTGWRIKGPGGAAQRLDLNPSTLYTRMEKLGIPTTRAKREAGLE